MKDFTKTVPGLAAALLVVLFLLAPLAAIFGLGLYYTFGIFLVADLSQLLAALEKENVIAPALLQSPLLALAVAVMAVLWGLGLSVLWQHWLGRGHRLLILLSTLPFILPRFGLGALILLACLQLAQWGNNLLGIGLVALAQAAAATPLVAAIFCLGWSRIHPACRLAAIEAGADKRTIFWRLDWPLLRPYAMLGGLLAFLLSWGDFYLGNALSGDASLLSGALFSGVARNASPLYYALVAAVLAVDICLCVILARRLRPLDPLAKEGLS
jgi:ABC-type spermidine/putrescine transport system permease subunit II